MSASSARGSGWLNNDDDDEDHANATAARDVFRANTRPVTRGIKNIATGCVQHAGAGKAAGRGFTRWPMEAAGDGMAQRWNGKGTGTACDEDGTSRRGGSGGTIVRSVSVRGGGSRSMSIAASRAMGTGLGRRGQEAFLI
ncbi:unnamed protein product [Lampetra fluviatilis]